MSNIVLSAGVRQNLLSLQNTADLMGLTQQRLATGKKVNSALDNPTNFFTSAALHSRAADLNALLDSMSLGIKTLETADNGIKSITTAIESMQSTLRQARQDKSFKTESYTIDAAAIGTSTLRSLTFSGGAFGTDQVSVALNAPDMGTPPTQASVATGAGSYTPPTPATSGGVTAAGTFAPVDFDDAGDVLAFDIDVDGANQTFSFTQAEVNAALSKTSIDSVAELAQVINTKLTGASAAADGSGALQLTSGTTGTLSNVTVNGVTFDDDGGGAAATNATGFNGTSGQSGTPGEGAQDRLVEINGEPVTLTAANAATATAAAATIQAALDLAGIDVTVTGNANGSFTLAGLADGTNAVTIGGADADAVFGAAASRTVMSPDTGAPATPTAVKTVDALVSEINANPDLRGKIRASNDNGKLRIENQSTGGLTITGANAGAGTIDGSIGTGTVPGNDVRRNLVNQFNMYRDQLDKFADDATFGGINLLRGDKLKITFNETGTSSIDIQARDMDGNEASINAAALGIFSLTDAQFDSDSSIDGLLNGLSDALNTIRSHASNFGSNLSVVENRTNFTKAMVNTLQTGGDNLVLADMNEEAANMLALQTRQQLSSTALSLASQADQAVLRLFG